MNDWIPPTSKNDMKFDSVVYLEVFYPVKRTRTSIFLRFLYGTQIFLNLILMFPSNGSHFGYFLIFLDMLKVRTVVFDLCHSDPLSKCDFLI